MTKRREPSAVSRSPARWRWTVVIVCSVAAVAMALMVLLWLRRGPSADDQLRAIDAARTIGDEENAAIHYTKLALDSTAPSLEPLLLPEAVRAATLAQPWRGADFPEAAKWVRDRRVAMDALLEASRKPECWFPLSEALGQSAKRFGVACWGVLLLLRAANNDFGEERMEAGLEKMLCVFRMAAHFRAQMHPSDREAGMVITSEGIRQLDELLITRDMPPEWLAKFDALLPSAEDTWDRESRQLDKVERLYVRKIQRSIMVRTLYRLSRLRSSRWKREIYLRHLFVFRVAHIVLALHRYKDQTGLWPVDLTEIEDQVPREALIDPLTGNPFVYRPSGDAFIIQSLAARDEASKRESGRPRWRR